MHQDGAAGLGPHRPLQMPKHRRPCLRPPLKLSMTNRFRIAISAGKRIIKRAASICWTLEGSTLQYTVPGERRTRVCVEGR